MTAQAVREALATAASTIPGVTGHPYFVQSFDPGTAWVRLDHTNYPNPFGGVTTWNVVVVLPQDQAAAEKYLDTQVPLVREAVREHLVVTEVRPQRLDLRDIGAGYLPVAFITGHREEE